MTETSCLALFISQVETIQQYFPVFDKLRKEFFVGELIWNFADFMTKQRKYARSLLNTTVLVPSFSQRAEFAQ